MFSKPSIAELLFPLTKASRKRARRQNAKLAAPHARRRARLEFLEDRRVLAVLTVDSLGDNPADTSALTLRDAITLVNNAGDPASLGQASMPSGWASQISGTFGSNDTIQFDPGLFGSTQQTLTLSGTELQLADNVTIAGPGPGVLTISGDHASPVIEVGGLYSRGAYSVYVNPDANISGLSIENGLASPSIYGGAGGITISYGSLSLANVVVAGNSGGGIGNQGTLRITDSTVSGNTTSGAGGGIESQGTLTISNSTISGNTAARVGGGISGYGTMTLIGSTVSGNTVPNPVRGFGFPTADSDGTGGGISFAGVFAGGSLTLDDCTIAGNTAYAGGGIAASHPQVTIRNSTVSGNQATDLSGPIGSSQGGGILTGGSYYDPPFTPAMENSIVAGNTNGDVAGDYRILYAPGDNLIGGDPMLGPLQDNGGPTQTMMPLAGSPAIDTGNATALTRSTDQRGFARVVGGGLDFGAVESGAVAAVSDLEITGQAPATADWAGEITYTLTVTNKGSNDQSGVNLIDTLPDNATLVSWQQTSGPGGWSLAAPASGGTGTVAAWGGSLASGASATFTLVLKHNPVATLYGYLVEDNVVDNASVGPLAGDPVAVNNSVAFTTSIVDVPTATTSVFTEGDGIHALSPDGSSVAGEPLTILATVTSVPYLNAAPPGGTVTFYDGGVSIGTAALVNYGGGGEQVSLTLPLLTAGSHLITAAYTSGDATYAASPQSAAYNQVVNQAETLTTVASTAARSTAAYGENVTFTANVGVVAPGAGTLTGMVQFQVDGENLGNPVPLDANDQASISTAAIPIGNHRVTAVYSGNADFLSSTGLLPGTISTFAGNGGYVYFGPVDAKNAVLSSPSSVAVDSSGNVFMAGADGWIRKLDHTTGIVSIFGPPTGPAYSYNYPAQVGLACDAAGDLFIADPGNNVVDKVTPSGAVTIVAGTSRPYDGYDSGDGGLATAATLNQPSGLAFDAAGDLFIADTGSGGGTIREINTAGIITTIAGGGTGYNADYSVYLGNGDGGPATAAVLTSPTGIAFDAAGNIFIADTYSGAVRKVDAATGVISSFVTGLSSPTGVAVGAAGNVFIADTYDNVISEVSPSGIISTVAGTSGVGGYSGDGGPAATALLSVPSSLAFDAAGNLLIADAGNNVIREVNSAGTISTVVGGGTLGTAGNGGPATNAPLSYPDNLAVDSAGNLFIADLGNNVVREVSPAGVIITVAGDGTSGYSGDGGLATAAQLSDPNGLALDAAGDLFIADGANNVVREVTRAGIITTVAGNGIAGYSGDGGPATAASLHLTPYAWVFPSPLAVDGQGDLFIADGENGVIREVSAAGTISTVILPSTFDYGSISLPVANYFGGGAGGLGFVQGLAVDAAGDLFISSGGVVLELSNAGTLSIVAGAVYPFQGQSADDGGPALGAVLGSAGALAFDAAGNLLIADTGDGAIRSVSPAGIITTVAGGGSGYDSNGNYLGNGDGGPATSVGLYHPAGIATDAAGDLFISEGNVVRKVSPSLVVTQDATSTAVTSDSTSSVFGQTVTFSVTVGAAAPGSGTPTGTVQLVVDGNNFGSPLPLDASDTASLSTAALSAGRHTITAVYGGDAHFQASKGGLVTSGGLRGTITTVAGDHAAGPGYSGDGGPAIAAQLNFGDPTEAQGQVAVDAAGDLFIADIFNQVVRKVSPDGTISTVAGNGSVGYSGDGGLATNAQFDLPFGVAVDAAGNLFIADAGNNVVREVNTAGIISTVAGNGAAGYSGDGDLATGAELSSPIRVAVDAAGDLFIADFGNLVIRKVAPSGVITTVAGNGNQGYSGDGGPATDAEFSTITGLAADAAGDIFITDAGYNNLVREVRGGIITTVAGVYVPGLTQDELLAPGGAGTPYYSGDGGLATNAVLHGPFDVAVDAFGDLFISDYGNNVVREVTAAGIISTVAGDGYFGYLGDGGPATAAELGGPDGIAVDALGNLFIADGANSVIREVSPTFVVNAVTTASLRQILATNNSLALQVATNADAENAISAINALPSYAASPVTVTLNLGAGSFTDMTASPPPGVTLVINGNGTTTTIVGHSPALTVTSGNVFVSGVIFTTASDSPTVLVSGGRLTLRGDTLEESGGFNDAALAVTGGTTDLGTTADPGGNTLNVNGPGELIHNSGASAISAIGDTFEQDGAALASPYRIADHVFDALDAGGGGLVSYVAGNVYVTSGSGSIQRGVEAVAVGGVVHVEAGNFHRFTDYNVGAKPLTVAFQNGPIVSQTLETDGSGTLRVVGSAGFNHVNFEPGEAAGSIDVQIEHLPTGTFAPTGRIIAHGGADDAHIEVSEQITLLALLFADGADGHLRGGGGPTIEVGGGGDNTLLRGGQGRNLLIAGHGRAQMEGGNKDDILIGGYTDYDANEAALLAIMAEWTHSYDPSNSLDDFRIRVGHLTSGGGLNVVSGLPVVLNAATVHSNGLRDNLDGDGGRDLFFAALAGHGHDKLEDAARGDVVVDLG